MSRESRVNILRRSATRRDILEKDRFHVKLYVEGKVPKNSYIFIGDIKHITIDPDVLRRKYIELAEKFLSGRYRTTFNFSQEAKQYLTLDIGRSNITHTLDSKPIIPGSSLKGALRSRLEYKLVVKEGVSYSCYSVLSPRQEVDTNSRHVKFWGEDILELKTSCNFNLSENVCSVCDIFGAPGLSSRVIIDNAQPVNDVELVEVSIRNLKLRVIPPGSSFRLDIYGLNFNYLDLGLLLVSMEYYTGSPIILGAYKYMYNPVVGGNINNKYFGLIRLSLKKLETIFQSDKSVTEDSLLNKAAEEVNRLREEGFLDLYKGCISIEE